MEVEQQHADVPTGWEVVTAQPPAPPAPSKGHDFKILGINIHVPAEEKPRADSNMIGTASGSGIAPEDALMGGAAVRGIVKAAQAGGPLAAVKNAVAQASPVVKYEATKSLLEKMGVPTPLAMAAAITLSGYKRGEPVPTTEPPTGPHLDRSVPVRPSELTQQQIGERLKFGYGTPPVAPEKPMLNARGAVPVEPVVASPAPPVAPVGPSAQSVAPPPSVESAPSPPPANSLPDQKALNEAALARRRAAYQASQAAVQTPAPAAKPTLLASEAKEYLRMIQSGKTAQEAMASIELQRQFLAGSGLTTPTPAETRFPKGMRGGLPK